jgi:hypothetical protein
MSDDEVLVTIAALIIGPVLWAVWLFRMSRIQAVRGGNSRVGAVAAALAACVLIVFAVLKVGGSSDVVTAPPYLFMYVVLGLAWCRAAQATFSYLGLSPRDDAIERRNEAAMAALIGALVAVALCYAGGNIGNGPGWWVVLFSAGLATGGLIVMWAALGRLTSVADAVTIDRDPAAGLRLAAYLIACGLILGRGVAGDWESAGATVADFLPALPAVMVVLIVAVLVERTARPTPQRPQAPMVRLGVLPAVLYLVIALGEVAWKGWPV